MAGHTWSLAEVSVDKDLTLFEVFGPPSVAGLVESDQFILRSRPGRMACPPLPERLSTMRQQLPWNQTAFGFPFGSGNEDLPMTFVPAPVASEHKLNFERDTNHLSSSLPDFNPHSPANVNLFPSKSVSCLCGRLYTSCPCGHRPETRNR